MGLIHVKLTVMVGGGAWHVLRLCAIAAETAGHIHREDMDRSDGMQMIRPQRCFAFQGSSAAAGAVTSIMEKGP